MAHWLRTFLMVLGLSLSGLTGSYGQEGRVVSDLSPVYLPYNVERSYDQGEWRQTRPQYFPAEYWNWKNPCDRAIEEFKKVQDALDEEKAKCLEEDDTLQPFFQVNNCPEYDQEKFNNLLAELLAEWNDARGEVCNQCNNTWPEDLGLLGACY